MQLPLVRAILEPGYSYEHRLVGYSYKESKLGSIVPGDDVLKECALTRAFMVAQSAGTLKPEDLSIVILEDPRGNRINPTSLTLDAIKGFYKTGYTSFTASQSMVESGRLLVSPTHTVNDMVKRLFGDEFHGAIDTHKHLKLMQLACQEGRLIGGEPLSTSEKAKLSEPVEQMSLRAYFADKDPSEDGPIYVNPDIWDKVVKAYSTSYHPITYSCSLIKVNSCSSQIVIKGLLQRATQWEWERIQKRAGRKDFDVFLCGNAVKYSTFDLHSVHELDETYFAYHTDSTIQRANSVNISKQLMTRSGMDMNQFAPIADPVFKRLQGICKFNLDDVLAALGASFKEEDAPLEHLSALHKRITQHGLPPDHPVNASQVLDLGMSYIEARIARIAIPGIHGMGAPSGHIRGVVGVNPHTFERWMRIHKTNDVYVHRSPYLGPYGGRYAKLAEMDTDSVKINWEDALAMDGDFDGDQYYIVPAHFIPGARTGVKPPRPPKTDKGLLPLTPDNLLNAIVQLADNKTSIGERDRLLTMGFDRLHEAESRGNAADINSWALNIEQLQNHEQQAVEGLKHGTKPVLTPLDIRNMFGSSPETHPYTRLISKQALGSIKMRTTRKSGRGYIDMVAEQVDDSFVYHPLHPLFTRLASIEIANEIDVLPYFKCVKAQPIRTIPASSRRETWEKVRALQAYYTERVKEWNGGVDKNKTFGKHVLKPVRAYWAALIASLGGNVGAIRDIHRMMAECSYEPQPNWDMISEGRPPHPKGLLQTMHYLDGPSRRVRTTGDLTRAVWRGYNPPLDGVVAVPVGEATYYYRRYIPRPGALFHHLATAAEAQRIFDDVLPVPNSEDFTKMLKQAALEA